jgi:hypothetical protein
MGEVRGDSCGWRCRGRPPDASGDCRRGRRRREAPYAPVEGSRKRPGRAAGPRYSAGRARRGCGRFLPLLFSARHGTWLASPRTRTSALSPLGDWARGKPLHPSSLHRIYSMPPLLRKNKHPNQQQHLSRSRNSRVEKIQPIEIASEKAGSVWIRRMDTVSITVTMRVTSTVSIRVSMSGSRVQAARKRRMRSSTCARGRPKRRRLVAIKRCVFCRRGSGAS